MACVGKLEHFRDCKFTWEDEPSKDKAAQSGSNLNITCALLKMPKSFKLLERIFSLINCVCWRVHNSAREMEGGSAKWRWCTGCGGRKRPFLQNQGELIATPAAVCSSKQTLGSSGTISHLKQHRLVGLEQSQKAIATDPPLTMQNCEYLHSRFANCGWGNS